MISDDTLMGTSLMTFPVQGTGWFGPGNFTAVKQKGSRTFCLLKSPQPLFLVTQISGHCSRSEPSLGNEPIFPTL